MSDAPAKSGVARTILTKAIITLENFSSVVILIMMLLTFADVIGRYVIGKPIFGASEMISALLALTIFAGLGVTNARDDHITVELFNDLIRNLSPRIYDIVIQLFSICAMSLIAFVLFEHAVEAYQRDSLTVVLEMPVYYTIGVVAFLAFISVISQIVGTILRFIDMREHQQGTQK